MWNDEWSAVGIRCLPQDLRQADCSQNDCVLCLLWKEDHITLEASISQDSVSLLLVILLVPQKKCGEEDKCTVAL